MAAPGFSILFVAPANLREAVLTSGLVARLAAEMPSARFTIIASEAAAPLFTEVPRLDAVVPLASGMFGRHALWRKLNDRRWTLIADLEGIGIDGMLKRQKRAVRRGAWRGHPTLHGADLLNLADAPPLPSVFASPATQAQADKLAGRDSEILAVGPGATWIGRAWPAERYAQVAAKLLSTGGPLAGGRLLVLGGPADREAIQTVRHALPRDQVILTPNEASPPLQYALLKKARLYLGNDTDLTLLAAGAGAPTLALYGPSDHTVMGPVGPAFRIVRGPRRFEDFLAVDPSLNQEIGHMMDLSVSRVLTAAQTLLTETESADAQL